MHLMMMLLYAAITSIVLALIEPKTETNRERFRHGLKLFGAFIGIGILLSLVLFPLPW